MPRLRKLKGVATGLLGSFVSRNNDIDGYWGVGVLCREAAESKRDVIVLDLCQGLGSPDTSASAFAAAAYTQRLAVVLRNAHFAQSCVTGAKIILKFGEPSATHAREVAFNCSVVLTDNAGRSCTVASSGHCWPHDPAFELRSARRAGSNYSLKRTAADGLR